LQKRRVFSEEFEKLQEGLFQQLMGLREKGICEFQIEKCEEKMLVKLEVELLRIFWKK